MKKLVRNNRDYKKESFLSFLFILAFANPYFKQNIEDVTIVLLLFSITFKKLHTINNADLKAFLIIAFFISFEIVHSIMFDLNNIKTTFRVFSYFLISYFIMKITHRRFLIYFLNSLIFLSAISILFYLVAYISPSFYRGLADISNVLFPLQVDYNSYKTPTLVLYTFDPHFLSGESKLLRNPGFAWEAGGFATYVNVAIVFYLVIFNPITVRDFIKSWKVKILLLGLILTFSTAGYLTLMAVIFVYALKGEISAKRIVTILFVSLAMVVMYKNVDFLGEKISGQIDTSLYSQNRFGAALLDWHDIIERPLLGWSRNTNVLFHTDDYVSEMHRPNGITNFIRTYGFIYVFFYFYIIFSSFRRHIKLFYISDGKRNTYVLLLVLILMGFSQLILHTLFTMSLLFIGLFSTRKSKLKFLKNGKISKSVNYRGNISL